MPWFSTVHKKSELVARGEIVRLARLDVLIIRLDHDLVEGYAMDRLDILVLLSCTE